MDIKICGLCREEDAALAASAGATHAGVIRVAGTPRWRPLDVARAVLEATEGLRRVGVFADADEATVVEEARALGLDVVQLHGSEPPERVAALRARGLEVWKVIRPEGEVPLLAAAARFEAADLLLLEGASDQGLGGVGASFDWHAAAAVLDRLPAHVRIGVAGGLTPENVAEAVMRLIPDLVDVSSGVEGAPGEKDGEKVRAFVARARQQAGRGVE